MMQSRARHGLRGVDEAGVDTVAAQLIQATRQAAQHGPGGVILCAFAQESTHDREEFGGREMQIGVGDRHRASVGSFADT